MMFILSLFAVGCNRQVEEPPPVLETETKLRFIHLPQSQNNPSLCVLIQHEGTTVLIDGGWDEEESKHYLVGYLHDAGVEKIDYLINTHAHADHAGGLAEVIDSFDVGRLYVQHANLWLIGEPSVLQLDVDAYVNMIAAAQRKVNSDGSKVTICAPAAEGMRVTLGEDTYFSIYNCTELQTDNYAGQDLNHLSLMVHFVSGTASAFIGGDASDLSNRFVIGKVGAVDVYSVQHHGCSVPSNSSSAALLAEIQPKYSVVSGQSWAVEPSIRARCEQYGEFYITGETGTILFEKKNGAFSLVT